MATRWIAGKIRPMTSQATRMPPKENAGCLIASISRLAESSSRKSGRTPLPSRGGSGIRLKTQSSRFSVKTTLKSVATVSKRPAWVAVVRWSNVIDAGASKTPAAKPSRIATPAISTRRRFEAGPARDIQAARRGCAYAQAGS